LQRRAAQTIGAVRARLSITFGARSPPPRSGRARATRPLRHLM
jgi:hypothetical protein